MLKKVFKTVVNVLTVFYILILAPFIISSCAGFHLYAITSGSMEPNVPVASVVFVKSTPFEDIQKDDIITFWAAKDTAATHRVADINKDEKYFTTKGDANEQADAKPVYYQNVIGKVYYHIPYAGYAISMLCHKSGVIFFACIGLALFGLSILADSSDGKKKGQAEEIMEEEEKKA